MRVYIYVLCVLALLAKGAVASPGPDKVGGASRPVDVPAGHWASAAVQDVVSKRVMPLSGGRFRGDEKITRRDLAIILTTLARSLEKGLWRGKTARALPESIRAAGDSRRSGPAANGLRPSSGSQARGARPVTRYELAAVLSGVARYAVAGLPTRRPPEGGMRALSSSKALPKPATVTVDRSDPAYSAVVYLAKNRMAFDTSVALKPGPQPVTAAELAEAVAMLIIGLNDRLTDEPQNREEIGPPPARR